MVRSGGAGGDRLWGWWLRAHGSFIEDEQGRHWDSVLDAFWEGHLGFPSDGFSAEQTEQLLRVLSALERRPLLPRESESDFFGGEPMYRRFYMAWLCSVGLAATDGAALHARITELGRSVLLLLHATREPEWISLPFTSVVASAFREDPDAGVREATLRAFENEVAYRRYVFAREQLHGGSAVTLTGMADEGRIPIRRVIWSLRLDDEWGRDDFFAWLAERVDRWDDWGEVAYRRGAAALSQRLLALLVSRKNATP